MTHQAHEGEEFWTMNDLLDRLFQNKPPTQKDTFQKQGFAPPTPPIDWRQFPQMEDSRIREQDEADAVKWRQDSVKLNKLLYRLGVAVGHDHEPGQPITGLDPDWLLGEILKRLRRLERFDREIPQIALDISTLFVYDHVQSTEAPLVVENLLRERTA